jgi:hypothetical protein
LVLIALFLLASGLPKNLQDRDPDKIVFRQVAERITAASGGRAAIISTSPYTHRLISLYANIAVADPPCPEADYSGLWSRHANDLDKWVMDHRNHGVGFFLYEGRNWPQKEFAPEKTQVTEHIELLGEWHHRDTGPMKLYRIK